MNAYTPGIEWMMKRLFDSLRENDLTALCRH